MPRVVSHRWILVVSRSERAESIPCRSLVRILSGFEANSRRQLVRQFTSKCKLVFSRRNSRRFLFHSPSRVARVARPSTETAFSVAEYAQKWEQLLVLERDILNAAIDQVSQFRGQLLQEEQISQKMTRTRNSRYN
ncbi:hypothetical protein ANTPLA_LOCUS6052 [Anthophora plagiata]